MVHSQLQDWTRFTMMRCVEKLLSSRAASPDWVLGWEGSTGYYSALSLGCTGKACSAETGMFVARGPRIVFTRMRAPLSLLLVFRLGCGHLRGGGRALPRIGRRQGGPQAAWQNTAAPGKAGDAAHRALPVVHTVAGGH